MTHSCTPDYSWWEPGTGPALPVGRSNPGVRIGFLPKAGANKNLSQRKDGLVGRPVSGTKSGLQTSTVSSVGNLEQQTIKPSGQGSDDKNTTTIRGDFFGEPAGQFRGEHLMPSASIMNPATSPET